MDPVPELLRFNPEVPVEEASTPPASWYLGEEFAAMERRLFRESWVPVARADAVREHGVVVSGSVAGEPWLLVRGHDDVVRGFLNVCRHHGAELVSEACGDPCAPRRELSCPYHGWVYDLEGGLLRAPQVAGIRDFDPGEMGLRGVAVQTVGHLVFMRVAGAAPMPRGLDDVAARLERLDSDTMTWVARRTFQVDCNWKVFVDNYLDGGYHVPVLHKRLAGGLPLEAYQTTVDGDVVLQTCGDDVLYAWVWPNLMYNRYGRVLDTNIVLPLSVDRCAVVFDWWVAEDADEAEIETVLASSAGVQEEDRLICESVQRGLASSAYDTGRYAPRLEHGMHAFHQRLHRALRP